MNKLVVTSAAALVAALAVPAASAIAGPGGAPEAAARPTFTWTPPLPTRPTATPPTTTTTVPSTTVVPTSSATAPSTTSVPTTTAPSSTATASPTAAPTGKYVFRVDLSKTPKNADSVRKAMEIWNAAVPGLQLVEAQPGETSEVQVSEGVGWPYAGMKTIGSGKVHMGDEAMKLGFDPVRVASHELGHILGLPDRRTGVCTDLMSGSSAGLGCTEPHPSKAEADEVAGKLANPVLRAQRSEVVHVDVWLPERSA